MFYKMKKVASCSYVCRCDWGLLRKQQLFYCKKSQFPVFIYQGFFFKFIYYFTFFTQKPFSVKALTSLVRSVFVAAALHRL